VEEIITYLEMTALDELRPGRPAPGVTLERIDRTSPLIQAITARVGTPHGWQSASWPDAEWARWLLSRPLRQYWLIKLERETIGIVDLQPQPGGEVEITTFGLLPEYVGRGLGGHALTMAVRQAWLTEPLGAGPVRRVWLHTSSIDHANALPNYERRGFRRFRTRVNQRNDQ
jgi:ribosomal protein S18 acetylase RimI-like enzyme